MVRISAVVGSAGNAAPAAAVEAWELRTAEVEMKDVGVKNELRAEKGRYDWAKKPACVGARGTESDGRREGVDIARKAGAHAAGRDTLVSRSARSACSGVMPDIVDER